MRRVFYVAGFLLLLLLSLPAANILKEGNIEERRVRIEEAIQRALNLCYAQEGFYPADLDYLIDNYGILIDGKRYNVYYKTIGANIRPDVSVFKKGD